MSCDYLSPASDRAAVLSAVLDQFVASGTATFVCDTATDHIDLADTLVPYSTSSSSSTASHRRSSGSDNARTPRRLTGRTLRAKEMFVRSVLFNAAPLLRMVLGSLLSRNSAVRGRAAAVLGQCCLIFLFIF